MQFNLSTLLLVAPAVAFGCTGWKLANWMIAQDSIEPLVYMLLVASLLMLAGLAIVAGRRVAAWGAAGFVLSILLVLLLFGLPPSDFWWIMPLFGAPLGLFLGSVRFACETSRSLAVRQGFLLPSCLMAGWMLAVLTHG